MEGGGWKGASVGKGGDGARGPISGRVLNRVRDGGRGVGGGSGVRQSDGEKRWTQGIVRSLVMGISHAGAEASLLGLARTLCNVSRPLSIFIHRSVRIGQRGVHGARSTPVLQYTHTATGHERPVTRRDAFTSYCCCYGGGIGVGVGVGVGVGRGVPRCAHVCVHHIGPTGPDQVRRPSCRIPAAGPATVAARRRGELDAV